MEFFLLKLSSLLYLKKAIKEFYKQYKIENLQDNELTESEWRIIRQLVLITKTFYDITQKCQQNNQLDISFIYQVKLALKKLIEDKNFDEDDDEEGVIGENKLYQYEKKLLIDFKNSINNELNKTIYEFYDKDRLSILMTLSFLDPRFKQSIVNRKNDLEKVKAFIFQFLLQNKQEYQEILNEKVYSLKKKLYKSIELDQMLQDLQEDVEQEDQNNNVEIAEEFENYYFYKIKSTDSTNQPFIFLELTQKQVTCFKKSIYKYAFIPCYGAECERVFSQMGNIISKKRNALKPQTVQALIFIKLNMANSSLNKESLKQIMNRKIFQIKEQPKLQQSQLQLL